MDFFVNRFDARNLDVLMIISDAILTGDVIHIHILDSETAEESYNSGIGG